MARTGNLDSIARLIARELRSGNKLKAQAMTDPTPSDRARKAAADLIDKMPRDYERFMSFATMNRIACEAFATFERETLAAGVEAKKFNKLGRDANALFRERMGSRSRPTWWAVNALQRAVEFCELYVPNLTPAPPASEGLDADALVEALERIAQWAGSWPSNIFGEPDLDAVNALLAANGMQVQMDRMHASWGRHLTQGIGDIARAALAAIRPAREAERAKWEGRVADWLDEQSDVGADHGIAAPKGSTRRAAYGGGSLVMSRAAAAIRSGAYRQEKSDG